MGSERSDNPPLAIDELWWLSNEEISLHERARLRLVAREIEGQQNIEKIADAAFSALPSEVSDQPVSDDWRRKFFLEAENICDTDLQLFWAKLLAGEVASPGSFSLRTLEVLKQLSQDEAALFVKICSLADAMGSVPFCGHDLNTALKPWGISYEDILTLRDAGLLQHGDNLHASFFLYEDAPPSPPLRTRFGYNGYLLELSSPSLTRKNWKALSFTRTGRELQNLVPAAPNESFLKAFANHLRPLGVTMSQVLALNGNGEASLGPPY